jgi:FlaA1/EpsC-like NDP-sugar epimerase
MKSDLKILIKILLDIIIISISCYISSTIIDGQLTNLSKSLLFFVIFLCTTIIPIGTYFNIYNDVSRYFNLKNVFYILLTGFSSYILHIIILLFLNYYDLDFTKTVLIFYNFQNIFLTHIFFFLITVNFRLALKTFIKIKNNTNIKNLTNPCIIYGAGNTGVASINYISNVRNFNPVAFIDDDTNKIGRYIENLPILSFNSLEIFIKKNKIKKIFLGLPSASSFRLDEIKEKLSKLNLDIEEIRTINTIKDKHKDFNFKKNIIIDNKTIDNTKAYKNKKIIITGAAGTIGEEICYQLINEHPSELILIDKNEIGISNLQQKLDKINTHKIKIKLVLANLCFYTLIEKIIKDNKPDFIFHAAAYKHVEIVQDNPVVSVFNNLISLINILEISKTQIGLNFVFISTDKAVEPLNYMGKSKRLGEIITNSFNFIEPKKNKYCSVRFGNVIGSSGSLIPKIQNQISNNSEITVTDIEATRYFMTINDAVNLTLQSTQLSNKGQIYVLDMGDPINIYELVKKIIINSGRKSLINKIKITGLRNGEKLHEKLYHSNMSQPTSNKLILSEKIDKIFSSEELQIIKSKLNSSLENNDIKFIDEIFSFKD